jgi:hypothetical protein
MATSFSHEEFIILLHIAIIILCLIILLTLKNIQHFSLKPFLKKMLIILSSGLAISALVVIILSFLD